MDLDRLSWLEPWRPLGTEQEALGLQRQLEREITGPHPLFGRCATVKGAGSTVMMFWSSWVTAHMPTSTLSGVRQIGHVRHNQALLRRSTQRGSSMVAWTISPAPCRMTPESMATNS